MKDKSLNLIELTEITLCSKGFVGKLQTETVRRLYEQCYIQVKDVKIYPIEVEVYYFEKNVYEDNSVHQNELQQNNQSHFYVHRFGLKSEDKYKGRAGIDFVWSSKKDVYYTWLLRSVVLEKDDKSDAFFGPMNTLSAIKEWTRLSNEELETEKLSVCRKSDNNCAYPIFTSKRIGLTDKVFEEYQNVPLRFVVATTNYVKYKYKMKSHMVIDFLQKAYKANALTKESCLEQCDKFLNYRPREIKEM